MLLSLFPESVKLNKCVKIKKQLTYGSVLDILYGWVFPSQGACQLRKCYLNFDSGMKILSFESIKSLYSVSFHNSHYV